MKRVIIYEEGRTAVIDRTVNMVYAYKIIEVYVNHYYNEEGSVIELVDNRKIYIKDKRRGAI